MAADIRIGQITAQWAHNSGLPCFYQPSEASTNARAKNCAFEGEGSDSALCLYLTDHQSSGRGRNTNTWTDATLGSSLLSSWSFLLNQAPQPTLSCRVGLSLYRACKSTWPFLNWNLKAPNDIYIDDKKIAGILLENVVQGAEVRLIIGIGMNVTASPEEVETSTNLREELPAGVPLLGPDYLAFMDRLFFELTDAVSHAGEALSPSDQLSLLVTLNEHPLLKEKYSAIEADGSLHQGSQKIHWSSL